MAQLDHQRQDNVQQAHQIAISDPWISRHSKSVLLQQDDGPAGLSFIQTVDKEVYGDHRYPILFRIGNGGAGYTGVLQALCEKYLQTHEHKFRIGWVSNHSRHSQVALLADVIQVALTYEPENEDISIEEGWAVRVCRAFNDHFILVGPNVEIDRSGPEAALRDITGLSPRPDDYGTGRRPLLFHTRGDGSATFSRERLLWGAAGVDRETQAGIKTYPLAPYDALVRAEHDQAFLITDRATFLTAKQDRKIPTLQVHVEGGKQLLNPCSALIATERSGDDGSSDESRKAAASFAQWLSSSAAQELVRSYGRDWTLGQPLFTGADQEDFEKDDRLSANM